MVIRLWNRDITVIYEAYIIIIFGIIYIVIGLFGPVFTTRCCDTAWHGVCSLCRERHLVFYCPLLDLV